MAVVMVDSFPPATLESMGGLFFLGLLWEYAEVTLYDVNSKASLQNKMHRGLQPTYTSVNLLHSAPCQHDCYSRLAISICRSNK